MTSFFFEGIGPFTLLVVFNYKIYVVIKRRREMAARASSNSHQNMALKAAATRQSYVLFVICSFFCFCHLLRIFLAVHELFVLDHYKGSMELDCSSVKFWTLVTGTVSHFLLTFNSSCNFAIYCLMSNEFRVSFR